MSPTSGRTARKGARKGVTWLARSPERPLVAPVKKLGENDRRGDRFARRRLAVEERKCRVAPLRPVLRRFSKPANSFASLRVDQLICRHAATAAATVTVRSRNR